MSLNEELAKLHELQKIDTQIYQREQAIRGLDDGESQKRRAIEVMKQSDAATATRHTLEAEQRKRELELKSVEHKRDVIHEKLYSGRVNNPKELGDLQAEEQMYNAQISEMEGPLLEVMDQAEAARGQEAQLLDELSAAKRRWKAIVEHAKAETARLQQEIVNLRPLRAHAAAEVDKQLLRRYDDTRARREGLAIVVTGNDSCPACHLKLTTRVMLSLREGEEITCCENCDRILLWTLPQDAPS